MNDKEYQVLKFLRAQNSWVTAAVISSALKCSVRSVKTYISNIHLEYPDLIRSSREGYLISSKEQLSAIISGSQEEIPQTAKSRKAYVLKILLIDRQTKNLDDLANELCVSTVTLEKEFIKIKAELRKFDLALRTKTNRVFIDGLEKNKKKMLSHLIYEETKDFLNNLELMQRYIPNFDLKIIKHVVSEILLLNQYFMDDFSLLNFVLHIGITMEHSGETGGRTEPTDSNSLHQIPIPAHIYSLLEQICNHLEKLFRVKFTEQEQYDLALILMTRIVHEKMMHTDGLDINEIAGANIRTLVELIQKKVRDTFYLNLNSHDFLIRFSLHIRNMLVRLEYQIDLKNPQLLFIKNSFPYIYDVSVFIATIISGECGAMASEDEIAYIALHIGALVEEQKAFKNKIRIRVCYPQYYSTHSRLINRLQMIFEDSIILVGVTTSFDELNKYNDYDLIITTLPLHNYSVKPVVYISNYLNNKDIGNIADAIEEVKKIRIRSVLERKLKFLFQKELFFYNSGFLNQNDAIDHLSEALYRYGHVDCSFREKLYERENVSSSAYANIAMPHPLEMCARSTAIAVSIHPAGIKWNTSQVNIVFMLAIHEDDKILFKDIFDFVSEILDKEKSCRAILNTTTYEDFIQLLLSFV